MNTNKKYIVDQGSVNPKMFERFPTGKLIDSLLSDDGGLMRATITMVIGDPGVGKTTITNDLLADIQAAFSDADVLFISSEESLIDRAYNQRKSPKTRNTPTLFLGATENRKIALEEALDEGWDIILVDSFKDVQDKVNMEFDDMTMAEAEAWLLNKMVDCSQGKNQKGIYTAFLCIQQVTKGREFVGSNALKHNTTAMMEMRFSKEYEGQRYVEFTKNRRCGSMVGKKLYYHFDEEKSELDYSFEPQNLKGTTKEAALVGDIIQLPAGFYTIAKLLEFIPTDLPFPERSRLAKELYKQSQEGKPLCAKIKK